MLTIVNNSNPELIHAELKFPHALTLSHITKKCIV